MIKRTVVIKRGKPCPDMHKTLMRITHPISSRESNVALVKLKGKYPQLKAKHGIDFHFLDRSRFTIPMMVKLGVPIHEIIIGRLHPQTREHVRGEGLRKLLDEVANMSHSNCPEYKKLNFRSLISHGLSLHTLLENHVPLGLLILEGFTNEELMHEGISEEKIESIRKVHKAHPRMFGLPKN